MGYSGGEGGPGGPIGQDMRPLEIGCGIPEPRGGQAMPNATGRLNWGRVGRSGDSGLDSQVTLGKSGEKWGSWVKRFGCTGEKWGKVGIVG